MRAPGMIQLQSSPKIPGAAFGLTRATRLMIFQADAASRHASTQVTDGFGREQSIFISKSPAWWPRQGLWLSGRIPCLRNRCSHPGGTLGWTWLAHYGSDADCGRVQTPVGDRIDFVPRGRGDRWARRQDLVVGCCGDWCRWWRYAGFPHRSGCVCMGQIGARRLTTPSSRRCFAARLRCWQVARTSK